MPGMARRARALEGTIKELTAKVQALEGTLANSVAAARQTDQAHAALAEAEAKAAALTAKVAELEGLLAAAKVAGGGSSAAAEACQAGSSVQSRPSLRGRRISGCSA